MTRSLGMILLALVATSAPASAGLFQYKAQGGTSTVWGSIGGTSFGASTWELTGTGDTANLSYTAAPYPTYSIPMSVTLKLFEGSTTHTLVLNNAAGQTWSAISLDYSSVVPGSGMGGFAPLPLPPAGTMTGGAYGGDSGIFNTLSAPGHWNAGVSSIWGNNMVFSSNLGQLVLANSLSSTDGYWEIKAVGIPEPATATLLGIAGVAFVAARSRRRSR